MEFIRTVVLQLSSTPEFDLLGKVTLLFICGLLCLSISKGRAAYVRHLIGTATFAGVLLVPLVMVLAPPVRVPVRVAFTAASIGQPTAPAVQPSVVAALPLSAGRGEDQGGPAWPSAASVVLGLWIAGTAFVLFRFSAQLLRLHRLKRSGVPSAWLGARTQELAIQRGIDRNVTVLTHSSISGPLTCGFIRPVILLPEDAQSWDGGDLRRALIHELEHIRRFDWAVQTLARTATALYWFHPLAWLALRSHAVEAERACDDAVLESEESTEYAEQLVSLARRLNSASLHHALGMANPSDLHTRVRALLKVDQSRGTLRSTAVIAATAAALAIVATVGPVRLLAQSEIAPENKDQALFEAAQDGDVRRLETLLASGASANVPLRGDGSALMAAAARGFDNAVTLLLNRGADPNLAVRGDGTALIVAARNGRLSTVRLLLDRGADINLPVQGDGNPLIMAARGGSTEVIQHLLDRGAAIEQVVPGDENALIEASARGNLDAVKLLVSRGANVNARVLVEASGLRSAHWRTPLNMARRGGHSEVVQYLIGVGARAE
ncbi:MAG TPA: M56 family metallopeptidase [Bryobacteraceae bacterium]|nr:M56 family metallopeptidase [Bryobacteraceae bacterium]